jgi:hypothetical protein
LIERIDPACCSQRAADSGSGAIESFGFVSSVKLLIEREPSSWNMKQRIFFTGIDGQVLLARHRSIDELQ